MGFHPYRHPFLPYAPLDHPSVLPCPYRQVLQDPSVHQVPSVAYVQHGRQVACFHVVAFPCDDAYLLVRVLLRHHLTTVACVDSAGDYRDDLRGDVADDDSYPHPSNSVASHPFLRDPFQLGSFLLNYCHPDLVPYRQGLALLVPLAPLDPHLPPILDHC